MTQSKNSIPKPEGTESNEYLQPSVRVEYTLQPSPLLSLKIVSRPTERTVCWPQNLEWNGSQEPVLAASTGTNTRIRVDSSTFRAEMLPQPSVDLEQRVIDWLSKFY